MARKEKCMICNKKVKIMIRRGTGLCSDRCEKRLRAVEAEAKVEYAKRDRPGRLRGAGDL